MFPQLGTQGGKVIFNDELQAHAASDSALFYEFRDALDTMRLTAWTTHELLNVEHQKRNQTAFLSLLASERLRRCRQLLDAICVDIHRGVLPAASQQVISFNGDLSGL